MKKPTLQTRMGPSARGHTWSLSQTELPCDNTLHTRILQARNIQEDALNAFLEPSFKNNMPDPDTIPNMHAAVAHTAQHITSTHTFGILADYDVDGGTSSALLHHYLQTLGHNPFIIIPHRLNEGYGPKPHHIDQAKKHGVQTLFMLDCGTAAHDVIAYAHTHAMAVIVLDHHTPAHNEPLPPLCVNPMLSSDTTLHILCAAGVTFMFLVALQRHIRAHTEQLPDLHTFLDLVAVGTICDMVPITGLNRVFVKRGLPLLPASRFPGLHALVHTTNTTTEGDVGFRLGPVLNAGSRMGAHDAAARLLTTTSHKAAETLCATLLRHNEERKNILQSATQEGLDLAQKQRNRQCIVIHNNKWSPGILGLIAARVSERLHKPTWVITNKDQIAKGAARSPITSIHLAHIIHKALEIKVLQSGGGHQSAAGFTLPQDSIETFQRFLEENTLYEHTPPTLTIDGLLPTHDMQLVAAYIAPLRPFGMNNPEPCFMLPHVSNIKPYKSGARYSILSGTYKNNLIRLVRFADTSCPVRTHLENTHTCTVAGVINTSERFSSFIVHDALTD